MKPDFSFWRDRAHRTGQTTTTEDGNGLSPNIFRKKRMKKAQFWSPLREQTLRKSEVSHFHFLRISTYLKKDHNDADFVRYDVPAK